MKLIDRADGVRGHFCIGRQVKDTIYWEFWNEKENTWCSAGTVYSENEAKIKMGQLNED